jgi:hypothetical protein
MQAVVTPLHLVLNKIRSIIKLMRSCNLMIAALPACRALGSTSSHSEERAIETSDCWRNLPPNSFIKKKTQAKVNHRQLETATMPKACAFCGLNQTKLNRCTGCFRVSYCSQKCQKNDWPTHKPNCVGVTDLHVNSTLCMQDQPCDVPNAVPDTKLKGVFLWESMSRATIQRSNDIGGHWPISASMQELSIQSATFASHFIADDCIPVMNVCQAGFIITGARRNPKFEVGKKIGGGTFDCRVDVYIKFDPNPGEIWLLVHKDGLPKKQLHTCTFVSSWVESGIMPGPVHQRLLMTQIPVDECYFHEDQSTARLTDCGIRLASTF